MVFCGTVSQDDLKTREDQWTSFVNALSADKDMVMKKKEQLEAALAASDKREALNQSRVQDLQNTAEQLRKREQAIEREKLALEVQLGRALKSSVKWKRQAGQWQREVRSKAKAATCDQAATPGGSKRSRQTRCVEALPTMFACCFCFISIIHCEKQLHVQHTLHPFTVLHSYCIFTIFISRYICCTPSLHHPLHKPFCLHLLTLAYISLAQESRSQNRTRHGDKKCGEGLQGGWWPTNCRMYSTGDAEGSCKQHFFKER
jgi:hypothetical protein